MEGIEVSIIIATRNRSLLLQRAINSAANQTYKNIEIIVVDDCSNDDTNDVLKMLQSQDDRIIYIRNDFQSGANASRNKGIYIANGKFIAGLDDDDEFLPNRIEFLLKEYDDRFAFITSNNELIFDNSICSTLMPSIVTLRQMLEENILMNQGLIKRSRLIEIGMYDESLSACQDYDLWMRLIQYYGPVKTIKQVTQKVYMEDTRQRISSISFQKFSGYFRFYKKYKHLMSKNQQKKYLYRIYDIRKKEMSIYTHAILATDKDEREYFLNKCVDAFFRGKMHLVYRLLINSLTAVDLLERKEKFILYGFGSLGKLIYKLARQNVIAIIDEKLAEDKKINITDVPIIRINDLENYPKITVIVTPFIYYDEIEQKLKKYDVNIVNFFDLL